MLNTRANDIRPLSAAGLPRAAEIAATAPDPWRMGDLAAAIADTTRCCLGAHHAGVLVGFACFRRVDEKTGELEMIAVHPGARRMRRQVPGVGEALLRSGLHHLARQGANRCLLEVRAGNAAAVGLYEKLGFRTLAVRPNLYAHPPEDGLTMELLLDDDWSEHEDTGN